VLEGHADYDAVFRVVRGAVHRALGVERPGLGLGLSTCLLNWAPTGK